MSLCFDVSGSLPSCVGTYNIKHSETLIKTAVQSVIDMVHKAQVTQFINRVYYYVKANTKEQRHDKGTIEFNIQPFLFPSVE